MLILLMRKRPVKGMDQEEGAGCLDLRIWLNVPHCLLEKHVLDQLAGHSPIPEVIQMKEASQEIYLNLLLNLEDAPSLLKGCITLLQDGLSHLVGGIHLSVLSLLLDVDYLILGEDPHHAHVVDHLLLYGVDCVLL